MAPEHDNKVTIDKSAVYFQSGDSLDLTWSPTKFISSDDTGIAADDLLIDIKLHELQYNEETSETVDTELAVLLSCVENTGSTTVTVPLVPHSAIRQATMSLLLLQCSWKLN